MATYEIRSPYGETLVIDEAGNVIERRRHDMAPYRREPDGKWMLTGYAFTGPGFRTMQRAGGLAELKALAGRSIEDLSYQNGYPRYTLTDYDHGFHRVFGNTIHHGIRSVRRIEA